MRIKCDRDYANSLNQIALHGAKVDTPVYNSPLYDVSWITVVRTCSCF